MVDLEINGKSFQSDMPGSTPLLWVLRDSLNLRGTKYGCGRGLCGACTVLVDGEPKRSCQLPIELVGGKNIVTIEGLSADGTHPLQKAWLKHQVPQCGYCQSGQLMTAAALLQREPHPTEDQVIAAMNGNICRCGTYLRIRKAILDAASEGTP